MRITRSRTAIVGLAAAAGVAFGAAPAGAATTVELSGTQTVVDEDKGTSKMAGSLVGDWAVTTFKVLHQAPAFRARGTERFSGCLDRGRDGSCAGDPAGTLRFRMEYQALMGPGDALVWGTCLHPVTGGSGAFAGARGVVAMTDTPTANGVKTSYIGNLTLGASGSGAGGRARAAAARSSLGCVAR